MMADDIDGGDPMIDPSLHDPIPHNSLNKLKDNFYGDDEIDVDISAKTDIPQHEQLKVEGPDEAVKTEEKNNCCVIDEEKTIRALSPFDGDGEAPLELRFDTKEESTLDPKVAEDLELIKNTEPSTDLEVALNNEMKRKDIQIGRLTGEVLKLKQFISKRKQVYKRKRKENGAPTRALSAYNIFVQDRFSRLAKENEQALKSKDSDAKLKRVPPASLVASTGNEWRELSNEKKAEYEER